MWDPGNRTKVSATHRHFNDASDITWPIIWILGAHHYRHRWAQCTSVDNSTISRSLRMWATKIRWRANLEDIPMASFHRLRSKHICTRECPISNNKKENMISHTHDVTMNTIPRARLARGKLHKPPIARYALKSMGALKFWNFVKK